MALVHLNWKYILPDINPQMAVSVLLYTSPNVMAMESPTKISSHGKSDAEFEAGMRRFHDVGSNCISRLLASFSNWQLTMHSIESVYYKNNAIALWRDLLHSYSFFFAVSTAINFKTPFKSQLG